MKRIMIMVTIIISLVFLILLIICIYRLIYILALNGALWGEEILGTKECLVSELKNTKIVFTVNKLVRGKHDLVVIIRSRKPGTLKDNQNPFSFDFTVQIRKGKSVKEKKFENI